MQQVKSILFLLIFWLMSQGLEAQTTPPQKVLFVGNSYTYFWNLPQMVAQMAEERGIKMSTRQSTSGGTTWGQHWRGEKKLKSTSLIKDGGFDAVIIQNHSMRPMEAPDSMMYYGELLGALTKSKGAQPYVYLTWSREWDPYTQAEITAKYTELAKKINARIVPVGLAWQRARELRPDLQLYFDDGSHPSNLGTYLSACVFFAVLTQQSPIGLPSRLHTTDKDGEPLYLAIQSPENALFCQKVAQEIVSKMMN